MPSHHRLVEHLHAHLAALGPQEGEILSSQRLLRGPASAARPSEARCGAESIVRLRAIKARVFEKIAPSFRCTRITASLEDARTLELAKEMARQAPPAEGEA